MKRLLVEGFEKIFQITKAFRANERGAFHNPEFTILEWYTTGRDYHALMNETEDLVCSVMKALEKSGPETPLLWWPRPFLRLSIDEAFQKHAGWIPSKSLDADRFFLDLVDKIEPRLQDMGAVFVYDFPAFAGGLARCKADDPNVVERFELYLNGIEICNGYSELADYQEQRERFDRYNSIRQDMGKAPYPVDLRFLEAMQKGLPRCAGNALGVDRLFMALAGTRHISDTIAFPFERI